MPKTYSILTTDESEITVTSAEFYTALNTRDENGKSLYYWYDDGEYSFTEHKYIRGDKNYLLPKSSKRLSEAYGVHHSNIENQRNKDNRCKGSGFITVPLTTERDDEISEQEIEDERSEHDIYENATRSELLEHLYVALYELKALDREIVVALYGLYGQAPMSRTTCATVLGKNWRTIKRAEERALAKFRYLLVDFSDCI